MSLKIVTSVVRSAKANKTVYKVEDILVPEADLTFYGFPYQDDELIILTRGELQQEINKASGGKFQAYEDIETPLKLMGEAGDCEISDFV